MTIQALSRRDLLKALGIVALAGTAGPTLLAACTSATEPDASSSTGTAKAGGTLNFGIHADVTGLDPQVQANQSTRWVASLVYSYLVSLDDQNKVVPDLAEKWEQDSPTSYTFHLRQGVKFHNGREVTAADVKYSYERIMNPASKASFASFFGGIASIDTPDDYTVKITLKAPDATFLVHLSSTGTQAIVPKEVVEANGGSLAKVMVGSGPYKFVSYTPATSVILERNPDYFVKDRPLLDKIVFKPIETDSTRINALKSGEVDMISLLPPNLIGGLASDTNYVVADGRVGTFYFLSFQVGRAPFNDVRVRQAVMYALDREAILKGAIFDQGVLTPDGPIPSWDQYAPGQKVYDKPDIAKAKSLLADAGLGSGFKASIGVWTPQGYIVNATQIVQQQLAEIGIEVSIQQYGDYASYQTAVLNQGQTEMTITGFSGNVDPDDWLGNAFRSNGGTNFWKYNDPVVDDLLDQGKAAQTVEDRKKIYDQLQYRLATTGPMAFLWNPKQPNAWKKTLDGFTQKTTGLLTNLAGSGFSQ